MCAMLVALTLPAKTKKDPYHLILEGKFLAEKNINCTVYRMDKRGVFVKESRLKARKYFSFTCDVGGKYIIRFEDKKHNTKFLMVDVTKTGYFTIDVDFSKSYDAILKFTKVGYRIEPLDNNPVVCKQ